MNKLKGKTAIVGIGEVPTGKYPERQAIDNAIIPARQAILDAGIDKDEIDYVMPTGSLWNSAFNTEITTARIVEELGLKGVHSNVNVFAGGASSSNMLKIAASLVNSGKAKYVLCVHADKLASGITSQAGIDLFSTAGMSLEWEAIYGQHYSSVAGLVTQRFMYETGTTKEQIAAVCVSNRKWAELNPHAMHRKPLTVEDVLSSKMLSDPLHAKMSNMLADGGAAFIVTSAERAKKLNNKPVYLLGDSGRVTSFALGQQPDITRFGYAEAARDAFAEAGLAPSDIDIAEIYDSYPIFQLIALEGLGFCKRGEAGAFVAEGNTMPGGRLPMTTNGGMLSQGHTGAGGGVAVLVEAARQLMGKAGERQVAGAKFAVETATGGCYMDAQVSILGTEIA